MSLTITDKSSYDILTLIMPENTTDAGTQIKVVSFLSGVFTVWHYVCFHFFMRKRISSQLNSEFLKNFQDHSDFENDHKKFE